MRRLFQIFAGLAFASFFVILWLLVFGIVAPVSFWIALLFALVGMSFYEAFKIFGEKETDEEA